MSYNYKVNTEWSKWLFTINEHLTKVYKSIYYLCILWTNCNITFCVNLTQLQLSFPDLSSFCGSRLKLNKREISAWLEKPGEKSMAPHSSTVAQKIPLMEETGRLQPMGSPRVGHDWATSLSLSTFMHWRSDQISRSVVSYSLRPHESQHARPPGPSPTPGVHSDSCPSSQWCHPAISSSVVPFSSCPQCLPASESFPMSQLFTWGGQSTGV